MVWHAVVSLACVGSDCGQDWTNERIRAAMEKGPHKSATSAASIQLVVEEVDYQVKVGFCEVIT